MLLVHPTQSTSARERQRPCKSRGGRHTAHRTDKASVVPAKPQRLQEPVPSIDLEVTAAALGAKHLLIVCKERQSPGQHFQALQLLIPGEQGCSSAGIPQTQSGDNSASPHPGEIKPQTHGRGAGWPGHHRAAGGGGEPHLPGGSTRFDVHPPSLPWQPRSNGTTLQLGRTRMEGSGLWDWCLHAAHSPGRAP